MFAFNTQSFLWNLPYIFHHTTENSALSGSWKMTTSAFRESVSKFYVTSFLWYWSHTGGHGDSVEIPRPHTVRHRHTPGRTPLNEWPVRRVAATYTTHKKSRKTHNSFIIGVRTLDPRNETPADLNLRPHSHQVPFSHIAFCHCFCADTRT